MYFNVYVNDLMLLNKIIATILEVAFNKKHIHLLSCKQAELVLLNNRKQVKTKVLANEQLMIQKLTVYMIQKR